MVPMFTLHKPQRRPLQLSEQGQVLEIAIETAANVILDLKDSPNDWVSKVGDGDCGSTMYRGAKAILEDIKNYPLNDAAETVNEIGSTIRRAMGGSRNKWDHIYNFLQGSIYTAETKLWFCCHAKTMG
nr:putative 3,4-dihydroxy-2-butanone kinase isoform X2 [Arachis hypogaea]